MIKARNSNRFRWLAMVALCAFMVSAVFSSFVSQTASSQSTGEEGIGEAPVADSVSLSETSDPGQIELAAGGAIDPSSRQSSRDYFFANFHQSMPAVAWTGNFASCVPGVSSAAHQQALLDQIAYYRAMAGVPADIAFTAEYNAKAQQAALMMGAAQYLDHNPQPGWPCYTAGGAEAAAKSNLHYRIWSGINLPVSDPVTAYMEDAGVSNANVGHRRWLLYPQTTSFGAGSVEGFWDGWDTYANAIWVMDANLGGPRPATRDGFVAWPPPGYVPYQVVFPRWSISYPGANFANATVTATKNGGIPVSVLVESRTANGYGENTLVWSMEGLNDAADWPVPTADDHYTITISNVTGGGAPSSFTYTVKVFDPATAGADATIIPERSTVGASVAFLLAGFPADAAITASWKRPTGAVDPLPGTFTADGSGEVAGSVTVPAVPGGAGHQIIFTDSTGMSATAWFEVAPRIKVTPTLSRRGETVDVSLRGFARQETIRIRWRMADGSWVQVGEITTSNSGSANVNVVVPEFATDGSQTVRAEGLTLNAQTSNVEVQGEIIPPSATISPVRSTVNNWIIYGISDFPPDSTVTISWTRLSGGSITLGTVQVDSTGSASGQFRVPATPGGPNQTITFAAGSVQATASFEVAARIKVNTSPAVRGESADISLRGYGKKETVRIRWKNASGQWIDIAEVVTSNSGSANTSVIVPAWAPDGINSVRGDGTEFRQQTNAVQVTGPPVAPASDETPTPTPDAAETATPEPTATATPSESAEPTSTPEMTPSPTETPVETPTPEPTVDPATPEPESP